VLNTLEGHTAVAYDGINQGVGSKSGLTTWAFNAKGWASAFLEGPSVQASNLSIKTQRVVVCTIAKSSNYSFYISVHL
jgi:hypothetical protein